MKMPHRRYRMAAMVGVFLSGFTVGHVGETPPASATVQRVDARDEASIIRVKDGDSVILPGAHGVDIEIRLLDIDAPEADQAFGKRAKEEVERLCLNKPFEIDFAPRGRRKDGYGRALVYLKCDGVDVNRHMVANGFAWVFDTYNMTPEFAALEEDAERRCEGLWSKTDAVPPWIHRKADRQLRKGERRTSKGLCQITEI